MPRWLGRCSWLLILTLVAGLALPVRAEADGLSTEEERKIGQEAFEQVEKQTHLIKDPDCVAYVRKLGSKLAGELPDSTFPFRFYLADEDQFNAFALPGGWIILFRGLIENVDTEGELLGVMAHEMSHVYFRHISSRVAKTKGLTVATVAGMIAGVLLGVVAGAPELGQAVTLGSMAGGIQQGLAYSRSDEMQADYEAFKLVSGLGYPPSELATTFDRLWNQERYTSATPPPYLLTHPTSPERSEALRNLVRRHPAPAAHYDNSEFLRIKTRLAALYDPSETVRVEFAKRLVNNPKDAYARYRMALVEMRRSRFKEARIHLERLEKLWPDNPYLWRAMGICLLNLGEYEEARRFLGRALANSPDDNEALLAMGQAYSRQDKYQDARRTLGRLLERDPNNDRAHYELGMTLGRMGRTGEASLELGTAFKLQGEDKNARYHLERALRDPGTSPESKARARKLLDEMEDKEKAKRERESG